MATYTNVTQKEFTEFIDPQGFKPMTLPGTRELVWGKVFKREPHVFSMRIYTGINPDGNSRDVGKDAMRVEIWYRDSEGKPKRVGGSKRVHRVEGWRKNLQARIDGWLETLGPACPECGKPMAERTVKKDGPNKGKKFHGCIDYPNCNGSVWPKAA